MPQFRPLYQYYQFFINLLETFKTKRKIIQTPMYRYGNEIVVTYYYSLAQC